MNVKNFINITSLLPLFTSQLWDKKILEASAADRKHHPHKNSNRSQTNSLTFPKRRQSILNFLFSSLEYFHYVHFDLFGAMDVHMFIFMAAYVYIGPENRPLG